MNVIDIANLSISQLQEFTEDFSVPIYKRMHFNSASGNATEELNWGEINKNLIDNISFEKINSICHYPEALPSLINYSFAEKEIMILGSSKPWLEILLFKLGAKSIKTVEYRKIRWKLCDQLSSRWKSFTFDDLLKNKVNGTEFQNINCFVSYSSLEHSGLGRYGDDIDPNGDINTLRLVKDRIDNGADFLIAFPLGNDSILFNRHRVYGKKRLKKICSVLQKNNIALIKPNANILVNSNNNISQELIDLNLSNLLEMPCGTDGVQGLLRIY